MAQLFSENLVRLIAEMPLSANLFRLGTSIQKHAVSSGAAPVGPSTIKKLMWQNLFWNNFLTFFREKKISWKKISVLISSETYANFFFLNLKKKMFAFFFLPQIFFQFFFSLQSFFFVLKSSETYAKKILPLAGCLQDLTNLRKP